MSEKTVFVPVEDFEILADLLDGDWSTWNNSQARLTFEREGVKVAYEPRLTVFHAGKPYFPAYHGDATHVRVQFSVDDHETHLYGKIFGCMKVKGYVRLEGTKLFGEGARDGYIRQSVELVILSTLGLVPVDFGMLVS